jgi:hypothetical protein
METLTWLAHAHSEIGWPSLSAIEQGIGLFRNEDAQQAGAGVRAAEVVGGASHGDEVFRQEEASGDGQDRLAKRKGLNINCEFYRLNVSAMRTASCLGLPEAAQL